MATNTQRIENLEKGMSEMQGTLGQILATLRGFSTSSAQNESVAVAHEDNPSEEDYTEPEDGKSIRIRSLFNGTLNLAYGDRRFVTFNKYGDENRVLYRDLIQIVNINHKFAEEGYFEIEDASAVYSLLLIQIWKKWISLNLTKKHSKFMTQNVQLELIQM